MQVGFSTLWIRFHAFNVLYSLGITNQIDLQLIRYDSTGNRIRLETFSCTFQNSSTLNRHGRSDAVNDFSMRIGPFFSTCANNKENNTFKYVCRKRVCICWKVEGLYLDELEINSHAKFANFSLLCQNVKEAFI